MTPGVFLKIFQRVLELMDEQKTNETKCDSVFGLTDVRATFFSDAYASESGPSWSCIPASAFF